MDTTQALPKGIRKIGNRYKWEIMVQGVRRMGYCATIEEAVQIRNEIPKSLSRLSFSPR